MHRLTLAIFAGLICGMALLFAIAQSAAQGVPPGLQGNWTATKAERDGKAADDVIGHRLAFAGNKFQILSKDGKLLYAGTVSTQPGEKPPAIDFENTEPALKGTWRGIFVLDGDTLTICDNALDTNKPRPTAFATKNGSGYVLITFQRAKP